MNNKYFKTYKKTIQAYQFDPTQPLPPEFQTDFRINKVENNLIVGTDRYHNVKKLCCPGDYIINNAGRELDVIKQTDFENEFEIDKCY